MAAVALAGGALVGGRAILGTTIQTHVHVLPVAAELRRAPIPLPALHTGKHPLQYIWHVERRNESMQAGVKAIACLATLSTLSSTE